MKRYKVLDQSGSESRGHGRPEHPAGITSTPGPRRARLVGSRQHRLWYYYILGRENSVGTVVLLPDHLSGASGLFVLAATVALAGHQVVLIDWPEHVHTLESFHADLDELLRALVEDESITTQVHLVGAGLGALLALRFAQHHPNSVASLVLTGALWQQETLHRMLPLWPFVGYACASSLKLPRAWLERSILDSSRVTIQDAHLYRLLYPIFRDRVQQTSLGSLCTRGCLLRSIGGVGAIRLPEERMSLVTPLPHGWRTTHTDRDTESDRLCRARWPYTGPATRLDARVSSNPQWRRSFPAQMQSQPRILLWYSFKQCLAFWTRNARVCSVKAVPDDADTAALMTLFPRARRAYLKGLFNNYPFLVSSAEFSMHVLVHLRRQAYPAFQRMTVSDTTRITRSLPEDVEDDSAARAKPENVPGSVPVFVWSEKVRSIPRSEIMNSMSGSYSQSTSWSTAVVSAETTIYQDTLTDAWTEVETSSSPASDTNSEASFTACSPAGSLGRLAQPSAQ